MSEKEKKLEEVLDEARRALQCLYLVVDAVIAQDITERMEKVFAAYEEAIKEKS